MVLQYKQNNLEILNYELKALSYSGVVFCSFTQNDNNVILSNPTISKEFQLENKIINEPTLLFNSKSFQVALYEDFEFKKVDEKIFIKNMIESNPELNEDSLIIEYLYEMEINRQKMKQKKFKEDFLSNINTRLLRIKEVIENGKC